MNKELVKANPILLMDAVRKSLRGPLLEACPLGERKCKDIIQTESKTAEEEVNTCARCYSTWLIEQMRI